MFYTANDICNGAPICLMDLTTATYGKLSIIAKIIFRDTA